MSETLPTEVKPTCPRCGSGNTDPMNSCAACVICGSWFETGPDEQPVAAGMPTAPRPKSIFAHKPLRSVLRIIADTDKAMLKSAVERPEYETEEDRFGCCPECNGSDGLLNVGQNHWGVCRRHMTSWWIGLNLFSTWREESDERHEANALYLAAFRKTGVAAEVEARRQQSQESPF